MSLFDFRSRLNARVASFQAQRRDVDSNGAIFLVVLWIFLLALLARCLVVTVSDVPVVENDAARCLLLAALSLTLSIVTGRHRLAEATLLLRAAAICFLATPWTLSCCAIVFHVGRNSQFVDAWLIKADHLLGFDWPAYVRFLDGRPLLWAPLKFAYGSILWQVQIVCIVLAFTRSSTRLYLFLCAQFWSLVLVAGIAIFTPAVGTFVAFGAPAGIVHSGDFLSPDLVASTIMHLRGTSFKAAIDLMPLITFPSYHACSAVLFAWALWKTPGVRWLALTLNLAMLAATPALGCHYLVDVIAGSVIAVVTVLAASAALRGLRTVKWPTPHCSEERRLQPPFAMPVV